MNVREIAFDQLKVIFDKAKKEQFLTPKKREIWHQILLPIDEPNTEDKKSEV